MVKRNPNKIIRVVSGLVLLCFFGVGESFFDWFKRKVSLGWVKQKQKVGKIGIKCREWRTERKKSSR
jgi:hypothetical protein